MPETSYAPCGDLSLAYQVFGDGPVELVFAGPFVSHVELFWAMPEFKSFFEQLGTFCRVAIFDKAGVGLSDPVPRVRSVDDRVAEIEAVMDAVGFGKAVVFGLSEGGPAAMVFAATRPERTRALILHGTVAFSAFSWDDLDSDPAEVLARNRANLAERYLPSVEQIANFQEIRPRRPFWVGHWRSVQSLPAVGPVDTAARNVGAHVRKPGDGAGDDGGDVSDGRPFDPVDDLGANPGQPCPR